MSARICRLAFLLLLPICTVLYGQEQQAAPPKLEKGSPAPPFRVKSLEGMHLELAQMKGKVVVLNFWFIACPPCIQEMPKLNRLVTEFKGKDVVFIAFTPDKSLELKTFLLDKPFKYLVVPNSTVIAVRYGVTGAPTHMVIDKTGTVQWVGYGAVEDPETELAPIIKELL